MAITAFTPTKNYADGTTWTAAKLDAFVDDLDTWIADEVETKCPDKTGTETVSGDWTLTGEINLLGDLVFNRTAAPAGNYSMSTSDDIIIGKTGISGGGNVVSLIAASIAGEGRIVIIKDETGTASTNNITVDGNASETIDGSLTSVINTDYGSLTLYCDGSNWFSF